MPVFTIETPSGHRLDIQADDQETALKGAQQWHDDQQPSGIGAHFEQGAADLLGGGGKTLEALTGKGPVGTWLQDEAKKVAPDNFVPAPIYDKEGFHASGILPSLARGAPIAAGTILGGMAGVALAPEAVPATLAAGVGGAGVGMATSLGNEAQTAADKRTGVPNSPITGSDLKRGALVSGAESAVAAPLVSRYLRTLSPTAAAIGTGLAGAATAAKRLAATAVLQGAASGAQNVVGAVGQGNPVDPTQVVNSALTGAATGGLFGAKNAVRETLNAAKYSEITPELQPAAAQFSALAQKYADGRNLDAGFITGSKAQRTGEEVYNKATASAQADLKDAVANLQAPLTRDAQNVVNSVLKGAKPHEGDYAVLQNAVQGDPQAAAVLNATRLAHVANIVGETGQHSGGKFKGGIASDIAGGMLTGHNVTKTALVAGGGAALEGGAGHLIAYSPEVLSAVGGASALGRLADHLTGARAPMGRFVQNFPGGALPAPVVPTPQTQPQAPIAPVRGPPVAGGTMIPPQIQAQMAARANLQKLAPAAPVPTVAPATLNPLALPTSITAPAKNIMGGIQKAAAARAAYEGALAAKDAVANSPFIEQKVGSATNVPTPAAAKEMSKAVSGANVLAKLQSDPAAEAEAKAEAKAQAAEEKAHAKELARSATLAAKAKAVAPVASAAPQPQITAVSKANGKIGTEHTADEYVVPTSPYGHMEPASAAKAITEAAMKSAQPPFKPEKFQAATQKNLEAIWDRARAIASEAPGVDPKAIYSQFAGVATKKQAMQHRDWLMKHMPQAAASIRKFFPDADINGTALQRGMWNR